MTHAKRPEIALVEDDANLREELAHFFTQNSYIAHEANNGLSLDDLLLSHCIDVIVLDLNLPGQNGFEIAKRIRQKLPTMGIIILSARTAPPDRLRGYESGADVFLPKPTPPRELLAAVGNLVKRLRNEGTSAKWTLDIAKRRLHASDRAETLSLTASEVTLLLALTRSPNRIVENDTLCDLISEANHTEALTKRALENLVSRLRKKLADVLECKGEPTIRSTWGLGYELTQDIDVVA